MLLWESRYVIVCANTLNPRQSLFLSQRSLVDWSSVLPYDPSQEPIFPPELRLRHPFAPLKFTNGRVTWFRCVCRDSLRVGIV